MTEKLELAELAQKFRNNASAVLTGDQVADEILNWAADFTIVRASEPVAWRWKVHGIWHYAGGFPVSGAEPLYAIPAPSQREEIARIIEARVLGGAAWEEPQASCYRAADAILALTGESK